VKINEVYKFLKNIYKAERFHLRDGNGWPDDYSLRIAKSVHNDLQAHGWSLISHHEAASGRTVYFDKELNIIEES